MPLRDGQGQKGTSRFPGVWRRMRSVAPSIEGESTMPLRFLALALSALALVVGLIDLWFYTAWGWLVLAAAALTAVGMMDVLQTRQAIRRNYPILSHFRFALGCIQSQSCHTSMCPTGVATQDP